MDNEEPAEKFAMPAPTRHVRNDERMRTSFANVLNTQSMQERIERGFGANQIWSAGNGEGVRTDPENLGTMAPGAAGHRWMARGGVRGEHQVRDSDMKIRRPIE